MKNYSLVVVVVVERLDFEDIEFLMIKWLGYMMEIMNRDLYSLLYRWVNSKKKTNRTNREATKYYSMKIRCGS